MRALRVAHCLKVLIPLPRMRNAAILVIGLKGVATEVIKNIVLAGIGRLVVLDPDTVHPEDLGASFFYRDEDVGSKVSRWTVFTGLSKS